MKGMVVLIFVIGAIALAVMSAIQVGNNSKYKYRVEAYDHMTKRNDTYWTDSIHLDSGCIMFYDDDSLPVVICSDYRIHQNHK